MPGILYRSKAEIGGQIPEMSQSLSTLNLLVYMTEQDIIAADRKLVHHKDRVEMLDREVEKNLVEN